MPFDLGTDPEKFRGLAMTKTHQTEIYCLYGHLSQWARRMIQRLTRFDADVSAARRRSSRRGILHLLHDGQEVLEELFKTCRGLAPERFLPIRDDIALD
ncbi:hypothetical protein [Litoreibacter ponti]|uniref:hypothetical protein n=1 Tax=Litoreibacter ponti TaxID=1510457 RepID=UPI0011B27F98|nr:hypothetical protein [Litoreibacter ponti]